MAALRDIARDVAEEIRDGIGWVIVYRTGRSWSALTLWSDLGSGKWETDDLNDAIGILKTDPDAVVLNGYYCGHFGEGMTIDEIAAGIRWHYEGGHNRLADYYEVEQGLNAIEEARKTAEAAGLPFCERLAEGPDDELDPYTYDGSMSLDDYEAMQDARTAREELAAVVAAQAPGLPAEKLDELAATAAGLHKELEGTMHRSEDVEAVMTDLVYNIRSMLIALPGRLAVDVVAAQTAAEASEIIRAEVYKILEELAAYKYDPEEYARRVRDREGWSDLSDDADD